MHRLPKTKIFVTEIYQVLLDLRPKSHKVRAMFTARLPLLPALLWATLAQAQDGLDDLLPLFDLEFETREGLISCNLIRLESGEGALVNCTFDDGAPVPEEVQQELGLRPDEAMAIDG